MLDAEDLLKDDYDIENISDKKWDEIGSTLEEIIENIVNENQEEIIQELVSTFGIKRRIKAENRG